MAPRQHHVHDPARKIGRTRLADGDVTGKLDAHAGLPADIRSAQPKPFVKVIRDLRVDLGKTSGAGGVAVPTGEWTLQVFASDNRQNAQRLVTNYPALHLQLQPTTDPRSPYRVLYGRFPNEETARAAIAALPSTLIAKAGKPLVKALAELKAIAGSRSN